MTFEKLIALFAIGYIFKSLPLTFIFNANLIRFMGLFTVRQAINLQIIILQKNNKDLKLLLYIY
jgi:hypothetical protein